MLSLRGSAALSPFRIDKILASLQAKAGASSNIKHLYAEFRHFVWTKNAALGAAQQARLEQVLTYGPQLPQKTRRVNFSWCCHA